MYFRKPENEFMLKTLYQKVNAVKSGREQWTRD